MDMEEYFDKQQEIIKEVAKKIEDIKISDYHPTIIKAREKALKALQELHNQFEF